jgi:hypothetical protein
MTGVYYRKHIEEGFYHNEINNAYHSTDPMDSFADQINSYEPQYVIDAGCGQNIWKNKVQNVTGFDWAHLETNDYTCEYPVFDEHTQPGTADFVFCLGSIHTSHSKEDKAGEIYNNLKYVHKWLKPGGRVIMRVRSDVETLYRPRKTPPLRGHLFLWGIDNIREWGEELGFKIVKPVELRQVRLQDLSDKDLAEFLQKFDDPRQQEIITNEQGRRSRGEPVGVPNVLKCWYIWWWQKV